jgi:hypothetical protein
MIGTRVKVADGDGLQRPGEEGDVGKEKDGGRAQKRYRDSVGGCIRAREMRTDFRKE